MKPSGNPDPSAARVAKARKRARSKEKNAAGDAEALRQVLWKYIQRLNDALNRDPELTEATLKYGHALTQCSGVYLKAIEFADFANRLIALEDLVLHESAT